MGNQNLHTAETVSLWEVYGGSVDTHVHCTDSLTSCLYGWALRRIPLTIFCVTPIRCTVVLKIIAVCFSMHTNALGTLHSLFQIKTWRKRFQIFVITLQKMKKKEYSIFPKKAKIVVSAFFFTNSHIFCINWKILKDLAFLWVTELILSCINTFPENLESTNFWHLWTDIPAQDDCTTFHHSSAFLGFNAFWMSPHTFYIGLRSGDWGGHFITLILMLCHFFRPVNVFLG